MKILGKNNGAFFVCDKTINAFKEQNISGPIYRNGTLLTGRNDEYKQNMLKSMLIQSAEKGHRVLFIDTRGIIDNRMKRFLDYDSNSKIIIKSFDVYKEGLAINLFTIDPYNDPEDNSIILSHTLEALYRETDKDYSDYILQKIQSYVKNMEYNSPFPSYVKVEENMEALFEVFYQAEIEGANDCFNLELCNSLLYELHEIGVKLNSWDDLLLEKGLINYVFLNSGARENASSIADMLLASFIEYRKYHKEKHLDIYVNDLADLNNLISGPIRKLLNMSNELNVTIICLSSNYYANTSAVGQTMSHFENQFFLFPTYSSHNIVNAVLGIEDGEKWPFRFLLRNDAILKKISYDKNKRETVATVYHGNFIEYFHNYGY